MTLRTRLSGIYWGLQRMLRVVFGSAVDERHFRRRTSDDVEHSLTNLRLSHRVWLAARLIGQQPEARDSKQKLHLLEVGCGWGPNLVILAERFPGVRLTGVDVSPASIALGRESVKRFGVSHITLLEGEASCLDGIPSRSADVVFTDATLLYLGPDRIEACLRELVRISCQRVMLLEMHADGVGVRGRYTRDGWIRDYKSLARAVVPDASVSFERLPPDERPVGRWPDFGTLIEIDVSRHGVDA